jgi:hypothetical protein
MKDNRRRIPDDAALEWLTSQPDVAVEASLTDLAERWGWNKSTVNRRLKRWETEGRIGVKQGRNGRSVITPQEAKSPAKPAETVGETAGETPGPARFAISCKMLLRWGCCFVLGALALAIAWYGIQINAWYGATLGREAGSGIILARLSMGGDVLALFLPATAKFLWSDGQKFVAAVAGLLWFPVILIAFLASAGFAALNISDTTAARGKVADQRIFFVERLAALQTERSKISESRPIAAIDIELQRAQPSAAAVWSKTSGCHDVTLPTSRDVCSKVLDLRQALEMAQRRDAIDNDLIETEKEVKSLPAISTTDPQADIVSALVRRASFGLVSLTLDDIRMARIGGMTFLPQTAGLVLMLAISMWPCSRQRKKGLPPV